VLCVERIRPRGPSADGRHTCRMNSASRSLRPAVGLRRPGGAFCVGGGRRLARSAWEGRFQSAQKPSADGRPARRMNSASRGLRPAVGLRRPGGIPFASAKADAWRAAPWKADFNRRESLRPMVGLHASDEFDLQGPSAGGRPAPTGKGFCVGGGRRLARSALRGRFQSAQSAQKPSADGRPAPTGKGFCVGGGRRLARSAFEGRFQSAQKPSASGPACVDREGVLRRRRPTPGAPAP
jgi:hypothetical protein